MLLSLRKDDTLALSSPKVEYMAATSAGCQGIILRKLVADLQQQDDNCYNKKIILFTIGRSTLTSLLTLFTIELFVDNLFDLA